MDVWIHCDLLGFSYYILLLCLAGFEHHDGIEQHNQTFDIDEDLPVPMRKPRSKSVSLVSKIILCFHSEPWSRCFLNPVILHVYVKIMNSFAHFKKAGNRREKMPKCDMLLLGAPNRHVCGSLLTYSHTSFENVGRNFYLSYILIVFYCSYGRPTAGKCILKVCSFESHLHNDSRIWWSLHLIISCERRTYSMVRPRILFSDVGIDMVSAKWPIISDLASLFFFIISCTRHCQLLVSASACLCQCWIMECRWMIWGGVQMEN